MTPAHPWIASYPEGVRWDTPIPETHVQRLLDEAAARWPDRTALEFTGQCISYATLQHMVNRVAKGLQLLGVTPGTRVGLFLPNVPHHTIAFFAALKAGATVVNLSPLDAEKSLHHKIRDSGTEFLITLNLPALRPVMERALDATPVRCLIVGEMYDLGERPSIDAAAQRPFGAAAPRHATFRQLLENDGFYQVPPAVAPRDAIAVIQYTGGTTGAPKGAMLSHANLVAACHQYWATVYGNSGVLREGEERIISVLPPFHIYALTVNMLLSIRAGAHVILHARFDVEAVVKDVANRKATILPGVPTMYVAILEHPGIERYDLTSLRYCGSGGAPLPAVIRQRFLALTGCAIVEGWGMTETSPSGTFNPVRGLYKEGSCGIPAPGIEIRIVAPGGPDQPLPAGVQGEIQLRGPNVMNGYWNDTEATAAIMTTDGFLRTGDLGYMDQDGYVFIVDRLKDMILCSGYNVYPRLIEDAIYAHPAVAEAVVVGVPDPYRGESPKAFVRLKPGAESFDLADLQRFLADKIGKHEMVQSLELRDTLPRTAVGKLSRRDLRQPTNESPHGDTR